MLSRGSDQRGFTLIELLVTMMITGILLTLGAFAARQLWLVRSLSGAQNEVVSQLQQMQERTIAASHPLVFGVRFPKGGTDLSEIGLIRYDPDPDGNPGTNDALCTQIGTRTFDMGVRVNQSSAGFDPADITTLCKAGLRVSGVPKANNDWYAFFYARGNATAGEITVEQPALNRRETVCVAGITGRVSEKEGGSC